MFMFVQVMLHLCNITDNLQLQINFNIKAMYTFIISQEWNDFADIKLNVGDSKIFLAEM